MIDISVILVTARPEYSIIGQPDLNMLKNIVASLQAQTFKNFELIVVDSIYGTEREHIFHDAPFEVKYVSIHPEHRIWLDRQRYNICGSLNTALMYAEGELIVRVDDCCEFDPGYLQRIWDEYETGLWLQGMHIKYRNGEIGRDKSGAITQDSRIPIVADQGGRCLGPPEWMYGYATFPLAAAIRVNGFDELFDGDKQQEDQDFGNRLFLAGYVDKLLLDSRHTVIEHEHHPVPSDIIDPSHPQIKCNYAIYLRSLNLNRWKANTYKLTAEDIQFIKEETLRAPCSNVSHTYAENCEGELFQQWIDSQNLFDLRERRLEVI